MIGVPSALLDYSSRMEAGRDVSGETTLARSPCGSAVPSTTRPWAALLTILLAALPLQAEIRGRVADAGGEAITGAKVDAVVDGNRYAATSDDDGRFLLPLDPPLTLHVSAAEFVAREVFVETESIPPITLERFRASGTITVTASRSPVRLSDTPSSVVVMSSEELESAASPAVDDALRGVPGFSLFRRTGSRSANPTSQGVSLRGVGASGASRSAVLDDGVPLNDAFGGWIYWGRIPAAAIDRIEVLRGGSSDLFGGSALSGVVQLIRRSSTQHLVADLGAGAAESARFSISAAEPLGAGSVRLAAEHFRTDGYFPVRREERGTVDIAANVDRTVVDLGLSHESERSISSFARLSFFDENRNNGTPLQTNRTRLWSAAAGLDIPFDILFDSGPFVSLRAFATDQDYEQTFSAITADRSSERLTLRQEVPSRSWGISGHLMSQFRGRHTIVTGTEARLVKGISNEDVVSGNTVTTRSAGGAQRTSSFFFEDISRVTSRLTLNASVRYDSWRNEDASRISDGVMTALESQSSDALSPRLAILYRPTSTITLTSSAYSGFRAPTLNELYRSFRLGNVVTNANENLDAERVRGYELGARWEIPGTIVRVNAFSMTTTDLIGNVTLSATASLITRQRQNIGKSRTNGLELDAEWQPFTAVRLTAGYLLADGEVVSFPSNTFIVGNRLPQVPRHQASLRASYRGLADALLVSELRWSGQTFEDDRNDLSLDSYGTIDLSASKILGKRWTVYGAVENLLNEEIEAGKTPVTTVGQPRSWRAGIRYVM